MCSRKFLDEEKTMSPQIIALLLLAGVVGFVSGYALRGAIRRELAVPQSEAMQLANRLEYAARGDAGELESEASKIIDELRARA
jgi:hypothetical protein